MSIEIVKISATDLEALQKIGRQTFFETFAQHNTAEDMHQYLEEGFSREKLSAALHDPNTSIYFALSGDTPVGYLKLNKGEAQTELQDDKSVEIERIYVLQRFQGKSVGKQLFQKAMQVARQMHAEYIWLGVWEKNASAIRFYRKQGFVAFDKHIFKLGNDEQTDILMKLEMNSKAL